MLAHRKFAVTYCLCVPCEIGVTLNSTNIPMKQCVVLVTLLKRQKTRHILAEAYFMHDTLIYFSFLSLHRHCCTLFFFTFFFIELYFFYFFLHCCSKLNSQCLLERKRTSIDRPFQSNNEHIKTQWTQRAQ